MLVGGGGSIYGNVVRFQRRSSFPNNKSTKLFEHLCGSVTEVAQPAHANSVEEVSWSTAESRALQRIGRLELNFD